MRVDGSISYTRVRQIGIGQVMNSTVYLADDPQLGGQVAAKEIEKSRFANQTLYFDETQAMFAVAHDNVIAVQYACQTPDIISLVMPYYRKGSLADRIQDRPLQLSETQLIRTYGCWHPANCASHGERLRFGIVVPVRLKSLRRATAGCLLLLSCIACWAQSPTLQSLLQSGRAALEAGQYSQAVGSFER